MFSDPKSVTRISSLGAGPIGGGWTAHRSGENRVDLTGINTWVEDGVGQNQSYLVQQGSPGEVAKAIDALLLQPPGPALRAA